MYSGANKLTKKKRVGKNGKRDEFGTKQEF